MNKAGNVLINQVCLGPQRRCMVASGLRGKGACCALLAEMACSCGTRRQGASCSSVSRRMWAPIPSQVLLTLPGSHSPAKRAVCHTS